MCQGKQIFRFKIEHLLIFTLLVLLLVSCKNERPQTVVTTPTPAPTGESTSAIDPTIAAVLAQVSPTPEITPTTQPDSAPTQTPEFVCDPPANWVAYTVQPNDTLIAIANALGISVGDIKNANCKLDDSLSVGEILYLPTQPPIPQTHSAYQQMNPSASVVQETTTNSISELNTTSFSFEATNQQLPTGVLQELTYMSGGGGWSLVHNCEYDGIPGTILVSDPDSLLLLENPKLELVICDPISQNFYATLYMPTGETIPFELSKYSSESAIQTSAALPLGHPPGLYTIVITDYPESGQIIEKEVHLQRGKPTMNENFETGTISLYYFEPYETIHVAAYDTTDNDGIASLISHQTYQINEHGYLVITVPNGTWPHPDQNNLPPINTRFAVIGEQSGFVSDWISYDFIIKNNGSEAICELWVTPARLNEWTHLVFPIFPVESGQEWVWNRFKPDYYDIVAKNCNNEIIKKSENVDLTQGTTIWKIP